MSKRRNNTTRTAPPSFVIGVQMTPDGHLTPTIPTAERRALMAENNDLRFRMDTLDALRQLQMLVQQIDLLVTYAPRKELRRLLFDTDAAADLAAQWTKFTQRAIRLIPTFETLYQDDTQRIIERCEALRAGDFDRLLSIVATMPGELGNLARAVESKARQGRASDEIVTRWCEYAVQYHVKHKPRRTWADADKALQRDLEAHCNDDIDRAILQELLYNPDGERLKKRYNERQRNRRY